MKTTLESNEKILKEGPANLQRGVETVGGKLYLTDHRLIFESHALNIQRGETVVRIASILTIARCWTKFLKIIPLLPNSIEVTVKEGERFRFVLFGRDAWVNAITARITSV